MSRIPVGWVYSPTIFRPWWASTPTLQNTFHASRVCRRHVVTQHNSSLDFCSKTVLGHLANLHQFPIQHHIDLLTQRQPFAGFGVFGEDCEELVAAEFHFALLEIFVL